MAQWTPAGRAEWGVRRWSAGSLPGAGRPSGAGGRAPDRPAPVSGALAGRAEAARAGDAQRRQPLLELLGRLAVEGQHEDAGRVGAALDELDDAAHQRLGLARPGRREHPRRAACVLDGGALGVVEPDRVGTARGSRAAMAARPRAPRPGPGSRSGSLRRRPMSSRSSREESPAARLRGSSTSAPNGKPRQNGRPRATRGWTRRRRISVACASNSSRVPVQYQSPAAGSPPSRPRRGSAGTSVQARREAKRTPGAAAPASRASSLRDATPKKTNPGRAATGVAGSTAWDAAAGVTASGPVSAAAFTAEEASRHPRPRRG